MNSKAIIFFLFFFATTFGSAAVNSTIDDGKDVLIVYFYTSATKNQSNIHVIKNDEIVKTIQLNKVGDNNNYISLSKTLKKYIDLGYNIVTSNGDVYQTTYILIKD